MLFKMKKLFAVLLVLVLVMSTATCFAAPGSNGRGPAGGPGAPGGHGTDKPATPAQIARAEAIIAEANAQIYALVVAAQATPEDDTEALIDATNAIAAIAKAAVAQLGLEAACEYTYYIVDGKEVAIDPLYVVNPLKKKKSVDDEGSSK